MKKEYSDLELAVSLYLRNNKHLNSIVNLFDIDDYPYTDKQETHLLLEKILGILSWNEFYDSGTQYKSQKEYVPDLIENTLWRTAWNLKNTEMRDGKLLDISRKLIVKLKKLGKLNKKAIDK